MPDPLETMRASIDAAHQAADQLVREAEARARASFADVPPAGWAAPDAGPPRDGTSELQAVVALLESLRELVRDAVPDELQERLVVAVRDLLLALRALIDWYLDRLDRPAQAPRAARRPVEDIPID